MEEEIEDKCIIKFNNGLGAILCSKCRTIIKTGVDFSEEEKMAMRGNFELPAQFCRNCTPPIQCFPKPKKKEKIVTIQKFFRRFKQKNMKEFFNQAASIGSVLAYPTIIVASVALKSYGIIPVATIGFICAIYIQIKK